jgi:uncharacterized coiled-coil protein SlyX
MSHFADDDTLALIENLKQQLAEREKRILKLEQQLADLTHDFTALGEQYVELLDLLKEKDELLCQIATGLEGK